MKILHITPSYKPAYVYGGVIESVARLAEGLVEAGHTVDVITTTANGKIELPVVPGRWCKVDGVNVLYFKRITKDPLQISPQLWKHLWRNGHQYHAIHIHSWWNTLVVVCAWICIFQRLKIIISPRGMLSPYIFNSTHITIKKWLHRLIGRQALSRSVLHATASSEYEECNELIHDWKGFVLPNILLLPTSAIQKKTNAAFSLLFLSRVHPKKGLEFLFEALAGITFPIVLSIAGNGEESYFITLKEYAQRLGISEKIRWLGWKDREEKFQEMMSSDCFILTSYNENFANVIIESLHVGTPVIISEHIGLAPFIREKDLGWITPLSVMAIRDIISTAFHDVSKRERIQKTSRGIIEQTFKQSVLIDQYVEQYAMLNAGKGSPETTQPGTLILGQPAGKV